MKYKEKTQTKSRNLSQLAVAFNWFTLPKWDEFVGDFGVDDSYKCSRSRPAAYHALHTRTIKN